MSDNLITKIHDYFTEKNRSIGSKFSYGVVIMTLLLSIDVVFKPSYNLFQSNKLNKLEKIASLQNKFSEDKETIIFLESLKKDVLSTKHYFDHAEELWVSIFKKNKVNDENASNNSENITSPKLSIFFTALSSSSFFVLIFFIMLANPILAKNLSLENIGSSIFGATFSLLIAGIITSILMFIPVIWYPFVNYLIYFIFQILLLLSINRFN